MGQPAQDWDTDIRNFWESGGTTTGTGSEAVGTASPEATGEAVIATATPGTGAGTGTTTGQADKLQGVMLASDLIGATITIGNAGGQGLGQGQATSMPDTTITATTESSTTTNPDTTATASTGTGSGTGVGNQGPTSATIEDAIVDPDTGDILFLVLSSLFDGEDRWIPVPLSTLRWDMTNESFLFVANANALLNAPFFAPDQFPDTSTDGWNTEFDDFWQNNGTAAP